MNPSHLFLEGEYPTRDRVLAGLGLPEVSVRPPHASHSIYEHLWHLAGWQDVVLSRDEAKYDSWVAGPKFPPSPAPPDLAAWNELVRTFLDGLPRAAAIAGNQQALSRELAPGFSYGDVVIGLAIHNAYHLGRIVSLRQQLGTWISG